MKITIEFYKEVMVVELQLYLKLQFIMITELILVVAMEDQFKHKLMVHVRLLEDHQKLEKVELGLILLHFYLITITSN